VVGLSLSSPELLTSITSQRPLPDTDIDAS